MKFYEAEDYQKDLVTIFELVKNNLESILPNAFVEHIGASSIPGAISKGDLDIFLGVEQDKFIDVIDKIKEIGFFEKEGTVCNDNIHMLITDKYDADVAVQVVVRGSEFEDFLDFKKMLLSNPILVEAYNNLKRSSLDLTEDEYRSKKGVWIENMLKAKEYLTFKDWLIRGATFPDVDEICDCFIESVNDVCSKHPDYTDEMIEHWNRNKTPEKISSWVTNHNHQFFLAVKDRRVDGVAFIDKSKNVLTACYLRPSAIGQGLGKKLVEIMIDNFKQLGAKRITLGASLNAKDFYEQFRFKVTRENLDIKPPNGVPSYSMELIIE